MFRMTEEELKAHQERIKAAPPAPAKKPAGALNQAQKFQALGRLPKSQMNKTEAEYAQYLDCEKLAGRVLDYRFHPIRVRLADNTYYEPDFLVLHSDMTLAIHETKGGFTTDKGQIKIKLCAEVLPFFRVFKVVKLAKKDGGGWDIKEF